MACLTKNSDILQAAVLGAPSYTDDFFWIAGPLRLLRSASRNPAYIGNVEGLMRHFFLRCAVALTFITGAVLAQDASAPLQGRWVVVDGEHNGKPMKGLNGGVMTVTGSAWEIRTASGNMLKGTLKLDASKKPAQMDMIHADGTVWEAVFETAGDTFRLNYVEKGEKDPRPTGFTTSEKTEESLVVLQRQKQ